MSAVVPSRIALISDRSRFDSARQEAARVATLAVAATAAREAAGHAERAASLFVAAQKDPMRGDSQIAAEALKAAARAHAVLGEILGEMER